MTPEQPWYAAVQFARSALSRQLVDHPQFSMHQGMLVNFRKDDGTWVPRRFGDFYDFHILPSEFEHCRDRFDLFLSDYATAGILLTMAMEIERRGGTTAHYIQDGVHYQTAAMLLGSSAAACRAARRRQQRFEDRPLCVGHRRRVHRATMSARRVGRARRAWRDRR